MAEAAVVAMAAAAASPSASSAAAAAEGGVDRSGHHCGCAGRWGSEPRSHSAPQQRIAAQHSTDSNDSGAQSNRTTSHEGRWGRRGHRRLVGPVVDCRRSSG